MLPIVFVSQPSKMWKNKHSSSRWSCVHSLHQINKHNVLLNKKLLISSLMRSMLFQIMK